MNETLATKYKWTSVLFLLMIIVSLFFNMLALMTPFLKINHLITQNEIYSLLGAVKLMWSLKLYIIAVLIVGFSIIFPFVKLFFLIFICFVMKNPKIRNGTITVIEILGKWSMLDIFIVCIILTLTNDQFFVSSVPLVGVYYFLTAILINMICSMFVYALCEKVYPSEKHQIEDLLHFIAKRFTLIEKRIVIALLCVAIGFFIFAIFDSYIQVSQFLLTSNAYSIVNTCIALHAISPVLSFFMILVLIIFPFLVFNNMFIFWTTSYHPTFHSKIIMMVRTLSRFMMLDVFCLSLFLFLWEGDVIIQTKSRNGLVMLVVYVLISLSLPFLIKLYLLARYKFSWTKNKSF